MTPGEQHNYFVHTLLRVRDWQDRPEFDQLCQWWRDGGHGVCALVGIGGAGKTAIAERFLQTLPGCYAEQPDVPKQNELLAPARLFVFSFYDVANPDPFFADLWEWVGWQQGEEVRPFSYRQILRLLSSVGPCLLVLDGSENLRRKHILANGRCLKPTRLSRAEARQTAHSKCITLTSTNLLNCAFGGDTERPV